MATVRNGAFIDLNSGSFSSPVFIGQSTDPIWTMTDSDVVQSPTSPVNTPIPIRCPAGTYASLDSSDKNLCMIDGTNPRYAYGGIEFFVSAPRTMPTGAQMGIIDAYNLNHAVPQGFGNFPGLIRVADLDNGVIAHRLLAGAGFTNGTTSGYGPASQSSQWSGFPWPGCQSDANWKISNEYINPNGIPDGSVASIPTSITKPGGLNGPTSMMWDCLQHYGMFFNVTSGTYPQITLYAEGSAANHPNLTGITWSSILPSLSIVTNTAPTSGSNGGTIIAPGNGVGGGAPVVALLSGITQGYPSIGQAPYTAPSSPVGIPLQLAHAFPNQAISSGSAFTPQAVGTTVPIGSFVLVFLSLDRAAAVNFTALTDNATGGSNTYTLLNSPSSASTWHPTIAYCLSTTHAIPSGTVWTPTVSPLATANCYFLGAYYRPAPPTSSTTLRVSNNTSTASSVTTLSTTLAGVVANDLVIGFPYTSSFAEIVDPAGMGTLNATPPMTLSFMLAASSGTFTPIIRPGTTPRQPRLSPLPSRTRISRPNPFVASRHEAAHFRAASMHSHVSFNPRNGLNRVAGGLRALRNRMFYTWQRINLTTREPNGNSSST